METLDIEQGSDAWLSARVQYCCASDAAAMLGLSSRLQRNDLIRMRATGGEKEFTEWVKRNLLTRGHEVEAVVRPVVERLIGAELYPATGVAEVEGLRLLASFDGITIDEATVWECKLENQPLLDAVRAGEVPDEFWPQLEHQLIVSGAKRNVFTVTNGTEAGTVRLDYRSDPARRQRLIGGWQQFLSDVAAFEHVEVIPAALAEPVLGLPALSIQVNGSLALKSNLPAFGEQLKAFIDGLNLKPETDQDFANAESACKTLQVAQDRLEQAEASALAQTASVEEMRRTVKLYADTARSTRLMLEKLVKSRKESIRVEIQAKAKEAFAVHVAGLNKRLGRPYMPPLVVDFTAAMRGKKTISSLQNGVDTALAAAKIEASAIADRIGINLNLLRETAQDHHFLFSDIAQVVLKANDDFAALVKLRITEHKQAEEARVAAERDRIRQEEVAKLAAEASAREAVERQAREAAERARAEAEATERREREAVAQREAAARSKAEADERARLQAELDAERKAREDADRRAASKHVPAPAAKAVPRASGPTDDQIIDVLMSHFAARRSDVVEWIRGMDLTRIAENV